MPYLLASNTKSPRLSISNNKVIQKMAVKHLSSYYGVIKAPKDSDSLIFNCLIIGIYSCKNKRTIKNKDNLMTTINAATKKQNDSDLLILVMSMEKVYSCKNKYAIIKNNNNK